MEPVMNVRPAPWTMLAGTVVLVASAGLAPDDPPLAGFRQDLLGLAFEAATAIPVKPHIKDRGRAQIAVVEGCLELDQAQRASSCVEQIVDWRRGVGYADLALWCARHGETSDARSFLDLADAVAGQAEDWRKERLQGQIARTRAWLEQAELAVGEGTSFDVQSKNLDAVMASGTFDVTRSALDTYAELYGRNYGDPERRAQAEARIKAAAEPLPLIIRIELMMKLARAALDHADQVGALALVNQAQELFEGATWPPEFQVGLAGRLAGLRARAGDIERARKDVDVA